MRTTTAVLLIACSTTLGLRVSAVENHWTGSGGNNFWTNSSNWSLNAVPNSGHDVVIRNTGTNGVVLTLATNTSILGFSLGGGTNPAALHIVGGELRDR